MDSMTRTTKPLLFAIVQAVLRVKAEDLAQHANDFDWSFVLPMMNHDGETPLHTAAAIGDPETLSLLLTAQKVQEKTMLVTKHTGVHAYKGCV